MILETWVIIAMIAVLFIGKLLSSSSQAKGNSKKDKEDKDFEKLDEELEDYDYLDDITGRDDKWWI
ncbi:MAG: hypothetical protein B1H08_05880 [Candidatus Omnitrophica bacterium 4484_171]|nr:MAG: hypothetical protein B1H08_05880 [Candidatus Omnitrophica bacterium 4484_171]